MRNRGGFDQGAAGRAAPRRFGQGEEAVPLPSSPADPDEPAGGGQGAKKPQPSPSLGGGGPAAAGGGRGSKKPKLSSFGGWRGGGCRQGAKTVGRIVGPEPAWASEKRPKASPPSALPDRSSSMRQAPASAMKSLPSKASRPAAVVSQSCQ